MRKTRTPALFRRSPPGLAGLKALIWIYFFLLLFEGTLRKWIHPSLASPLLIVRDPVVLLIYFQAIRCRLFPLNGFLLTYFALLSGFSLLGLTQLAAGVGGGLKVMLYGLRTDFLHLPLIFVLPRVFSRSDVLKTGRWLLLLAPPMALLMSLQFAADPRSFINTGIDEVSGQIGGAMGRIRPAGTFFYATGPAHFFMLATAFVLSGLAGKNSGYPRWLLWVSLASVIAAQPVSISRSLVLGCSLVLAAAILFGFLYPARAPSFFKGGLLMAAVSVILPWFAFFREGVAAFLERWESANLQAGGIHESLVERFFSGFSEAFAALAQAGVLGSGIGLGTNVGAALTTGYRQFLLAENEWPRVVLEAGVLGLAFLAYRVWVAAGLGRRALAAAGRGQLLPLLLAVSACLSLVTETISQPSNLGFMVFSAGLAFAAAKPESQAEIWTAARINTRGLASVRTGTTGRRRWA